MQFRDTAILPMYKPQSEAAWRLTEYTDFYRVPCVSEARRWCGNCETRKTQKEFYKAKQHFCKENGPRCTCCCGSC